MKLRWDEVAPTVKTTSWLASRNSQNSRWGNNGFGHLYIHSIDPMAEKQSGAPCWELFTLPGLKKRRGKQGWQDLGLLGDWGPQAVRVWAETEIKTWGGIWNQRGGEGPAGGGKLLAVFYFFSLSFSLSSNDGWLPSGTWRKWCPSAGPLGALAGWLPATFRCKIDTSD